MRVIKLVNNIICAVKSNLKPDYVLDEDEIVSELGELGQRMLEDGTFVDVSVEPIEPSIQIEEEILLETRYQTMLLEMVALGGF